MYGIRDASFTPLSPADLVSLADVKAFMGIAGTASDTLLSAFIVAASLQIERYCNTFFAPRTVTDLLFPEDPNSAITLTYTPTTAAITSISLNDEAQTVGDFLVMPSGIVRRNDGGTIAPGKWVVVYSAGPAAVPADVAHAAKEFVRDMFNLKDRKAGVARESVPDVADVTYTKATADEVGPGGGRVPSGVAALLGAHVVRWRP